MSARVSDADGAAGTAPAAAARAAERLPLLLLCAVAACASQIEVQTDYNPAVDFTALETYAWLESEISYTGAADPGMASRVKEAIRAALDQHLAEKGYRHIAGGRPDFFVSYHVVVTEFEDPKLYRDKVAILDASNPLSAERLTIYREDLRIGEGLLRKGTLIIFLLDPETKRLIWQGLAEGTAVTPQEGLRKAQAAVGQLMELFPPGDNAPAT